MTLLKEGCNPTEIDADMGWMERTATGWYAPPTRHDPLDFDSWLETPEGKQWLEEKANIVLMGSDPYYLCNSL